MQKMITRLARISGLLLGVLVMTFLGGCWNWFIESQVFFPEENIVQTPKEIGLPYEEIWFRSSDGFQLNGWLVPSPASSHLMLFCHGNAGNISHRLDNVQRLYERGISVFIFDYRGYGLSHGKISEKGFYLDSEAAYQVAREWARKLQAKLVIFGRSLGGIAAVHLGVGGACHGLILESTFTNMGEMARAHYPLPFLKRSLDNRLNAVSKIGGVEAPILFFHGDQDRIVPIQLGRKLYEAAPQPKEFVVIPGAGHNDTYLVMGGDYFTKLKDFLANL